MLQTDPKIIDPKTFQLLLRLQNDPVFNDFLLVGGTALALQMGHRESIDIDLFSQNTFDEQTIQDYLIERYEMEVLLFAQNTVLGLIDGIKVDILRHRAFEVEPPIIDGGVRMASMLDIAAMKLNAISSSGERLKDFVDVYFMLELMPFSKMLDAYKIKYPNSNPIIPQRAMIWFEDIDYHHEPPIVLRPFDLKKMKTRLETAVRNPHQIFS